MPVSIQGGFIPIFIPEIRKEGTYILGLIIGPNGCIVSFPAGTMHGAATGFKNTLSRPDLGKGKFPVQHRIRCFKYQLTPDFFDKSLSFLFLLHC